ncbi:JmjC domain-containing protein [Streptomyces sp. P17]|uniref:JmjC domain-containing protein n=1 Tax=Streptomyces sp. P17 TaxID=3074716 RepID=UPI0028F4022E|nr:cupin domain-containing protein [Streptomyces sp. P17]MDT9695382.1 cupin domain-containing protein [Streptomyces sp. P17]
MSLRLLLPPEGVADLLATWPDEPRVYERGRTEVDEAMSLDVFTELIDTGCVPPDEVAVVKAGPASRTAFLTNGRTDPAKLRRLADQGYTIRLGNMQRWLPFFRRLSQSIKEETGYSNYASAFLTPEGEQGLLHHWDQQMGVIVQVAGTKTWQLWKPPIEAPMREWGESFRVWREDFIPEWEAAGPDLTIELNTGQTLLLPRGWVHNPHALHHDEPSLHLTFAIKERTPLWLAEQLLARAIEQPEFRRVVLPGELEESVLADQLSETTRALVAFLTELDMKAMAGLVRKAAVTDLEYTT